MTHKFFRIPQACCIQEFVMFNKCSLMSNHQLLSSMLAASGWLQFLFLVNLCLCFSLINRRTFGLWSSSLVLLQISGEACFSVQLFLWKDRRDDTSVHHTVDKDRGQSLLLTMDDSSEVCLSNKECSASLLLQYAISSLLQDLWLQCHLLLRIFSKS